jgi:hypothetical protein
VTTDVYLIRDGGCLISGEFHRLENASQRWSRQFCLMNRIDDGRIVAGGRGYWWQCEINALIASLGSMDHV